MLTSLQGINLAFNRFNTSAYNIAKSSVDLQASSLQPESQQNSPSGSIVERINSKNGSPQNDLTYNLVDLKTSEVAVKSNVKVLQTEKNMLGSLLDIKA